MHSRIFQVSTNPINETDYIDECCYWDHWFINEVADYVANSTDRDGDIEWLMEYSKGIIISEDENGKFLIITDKEKYFKNAFENFQEAINKVSKYTIDDFIQSSSYEIWKIKDSYENMFGFYIDCNDDLMSLDRFVRLSPINKKYYIGGTVDYHY